MQIFNFRDGHVTTFRHTPGAYISQNAWSQTLQASKRHTFRVSAFHGTNDLGVKLFPVGYTQDSRRVPKTRKWCFWIWLHTRYKIPEFFTLAPILTCTLRVCRRNRGGPCRLYIGFRCATSITKNTVVLVWPERADRGLNRHTSVLRTTIGVCKILSRPVEIWQYEGLPAAARKVKASMAHSACGWNAGCAGKTVMFLDQACCTWTPSRCFMYRSYTNRHYLYIC